MQGNMSLFDIVAAHKITIDVVQYLIGIDVAMVVGRRNGFWMVIVQTRTKRTHHKRSRFKGLVYRRWLVNASRNRFKIVNRESVWEVITVPAYHIKRMCSVDHFVHHSFLFDLDKKVAFFIIRFNFGWQFEIPFAKWGMLQMLP